MKKLVLLTIALIAFSFANAQDKINNLTAPTQIKPDEKITISVDYTTSEPRAMIANLQLGEDPWTPYGYARVNVPAGSGNIELVVTVDPNIPEGSNYKISAVLTTVKGTWKERIDVASKRNVEVVK